MYAVTYKNENLTALTTHEPNRVPSTQPSERQHWRPWLQVAASYEELPGHRHASLSQTCLKNDAALKKKPSLFTSQQRSKNPNCVHKLDATQQKTHCGNFLPWCKMNFSARSLQHEMLANKSEKHSSSCSQPEVSSIVTIWSKTLLSFASSAARAAACKSATTSAAESGLSRSTFLRFAAWTHNSPRICRSRFSRLRCYCRSSLVSWSASAGNSTYTPLTTPIDTAPMASLPSADTPDPAPYMFAMSLSKGDLLLEGSYPLSRIVDHRG